MYIRTCSWYSRDYRHIGSWARDRQRPSKPTLTRISKKDLEEKSIGMIFYTFILCLFLPQHHSLETELKGNLIYQYYPFSTNVNPRVANFYRHIDLSYLKNAIDILQYDTFCERTLTHKNRPPVWYKNPTSANYENAKAECIRRGGYLPTQGQDDKQMQLLSEMHKANITETWAGLIWDTDRKDHQIRIR